MRRLLCTFPLENLPPAPEFDWNIEYAERARLAAEGGPEATSIVWTNRGAASDNFSSTFGTSANAARAVVDAALDHWERVITNWNRSDGTITLNVTISISGSGFGGAGAPAGTAPADGKPRTGSFTLGSGNNSADPNDSNGWYLDPNPNDHAEFNTGITNAFAGTGTGLGSDMYSVVAAELTHVLGLISDKNNGGGSWQGYLLESSGFVTNTGVSDNAEGGGNGVFWTFDGPTIDHLMTSFNSGDPTAASWGNIVHSAGVRPTLLNFGGQMWQGSEDVGNASYSSNERTIPSFVMAHVLRDAYGYTITEPATFGTWYTLLNRTTGNLLVRGGAGTSADVVLIQLNGGQLQVSVDVGNDIPGTGAFSGNQNLPAWVSLFDLADVSSITVDLGDGNDSLNVLALPNGINLTADMGAGNDFINVGGNDFDSNILANVSINAGSGTDTMQISDSNDNVGNDTYTLTSTTFTKTDFLDTFTYSNVESITLNASPFNNTINVTSLSTTTNFLTANGADGNDTFNIGGGDFDSFFFASVIVNGGNGSDLINIDDSADTLDDSYNLTSSVFSKSSTAETISFFTVEGLTLTASNGNNPITIQSVASGVPTTVNGGGGNDSFTIGNGDIDNNTAANVTLNGDAGTDSILFDDSVDGPGQDELTLTTTSLIKNIIINRTVTFGTVENLTVNGSPQNDIITIEGLLAGVGLVWNAGAGNDSFDIERFNTGSAATLNGDAGNDSFVNGFTDLNTNWNGDLTINGGANTDSISLDDSGDTTAAAYLVTSTTFRVSAGITTNPFPYSTIENFNWLTNTVATTIDVTSTAGGVQYTISGNNGADTFNVASHHSAATLTLNGGNDNDTFNIGSPGDNVETVDGGVTLNGDAGSDTFNYNDATNTFSDTYTLTSSTVTRSASGIVTYATVESVVVNAGIANNVINVMSTAPTTQVTVNGGNGNDTFNVGSPGNNVEDVDGALTLNGDAGTDALNYNDAANTFSDAYTLAFTTLTRTASAIVTYGTFESLVVNTGTGNDTIQMTGSISGPVSVNSGPGADTIHITGNFFGTLIDLDGGTGLDTVTVNNDSIGIAGVRFNSTQDLASLTIFPGGRVEVAPGGNKVLVTNTLTITGDGMLDLTNNAAIVDYAGASPLASIRALLTTGYAAGAWNGSGINSSTAAATPNRAVGYAESSALFSVFPASFAGQTVDSTAVLMRYTRYGDADLSQAVNLPDFNRLAANFGTGTLWSQGNFNFDPSVNLLDFNLLAANFGFSAAPEQGSGIGAGSDDDSDDPAVGLREVLA